MNVFLKDELKEKEKNVQKASIFFIFFPVFSSLDFLRGSSDEMRTYFNGYLTEWMIGIFDRNMQLYNQL
ncbi:CLUMA_CG010255, isoform A [Clunio marinus]|uniref:CLUMA_CG010255, isoform A n=1 Tax=Clunio marinus TaxID=568069 RepID=A0A1J1I934_9DIPT|nr:CLUMA_CG010255, isoform A [Clunio marinus]